jgi:hypothetical protein
MEYIKIAGLPLDVWAISGWMWGGTEEDDAISTRSATAWW